MDITIADIIKVTGGKLLCGDSSMRVKGFSIDSRQGQKDFLFVPIIGEKVDAHRFIEDALKINGAALTSEHDFMDSDKPCIRVDDTVKAMQKIGTAWRGQLTLPIVAVTGSVGKTTTREMIAWALSSGKRVFQTVGNQNSQIGVPLTLSKMSPEDEAAVLEIGMSERGQIETLTTMIKPNIAVVTVIGVSHIMQLKTQENICLEKMDIVKGLPLDGKVFLNGDDPYLKKYEGALPFDTYFYGMGNNCDYRASHIREDSGGVSFDFVIGGKTICPVRLSTLGEHNVKNALAALGVCHQMGISVSGAAKKLADFHGQRQKVEKLHGYTLIEDAYNASPDSMKAAIKVLSGMEGRKIAVLADMLELGEGERDYHADVGAYLAKEEIDELYCVGELSRFFLTGAFREKKALAARHFDSNEELGTFLKGHLRAGDRVLVKGSNGMKLTEVIRFLKGEDTDENLYRAARGDALE